MKKSKIIIIIVVIVGVLFLFLVTVLIGGFFLARKVVKEKAGIANMQMDKQGGKIELKNGATVEFGQAAKWPEDMPADVPEFTYGKVKTVTKTEVQNKKGWNVILEEVTADAAEKYKTDLKNSGWAIHATTMVAGQGGSLMAENEKLQLFIMFDSEQKTVSFAVNEKE